MGAQPGATAQAKAAVGESGVKTGFSRQGRAMCARSALLGFEPHRSGVVSKLWAGTDVEPAYNTESAVRSWTWRPGRRKLSFEG